MALKIKEGSELFPYGKQLKPFTSASVLSQEILEHLQVRFPDEIEEVKEVKEPKKKSEKV
jgi:hypothetical protein